MRKYLIPSLVLITVVASYLYIAQNSKTATTPAPLSKQKTIPRKTLKNSKYIVSATKKVSGAFPVICDSPLRDLSAMTIEEYQSLVSNKDSLISFFGKECTDKLFKNEVFLKILKNSQCELAENEQKSNDGCLTMMLMLKANFIAEYSQGKNLNDLDSQELAANFTKMFFELDKLTKEDFAKNLKLINRLHEMHPNDPDVLEAYLGYMMIGKMITKDDSVTGRIDELMNDHQGESFKVDRMSVLQDILKNDFESAKSTLERLEGLYPQEAELAYYQAAYHWKQKRADLANRYLDKAIKFSQNCSYCTPGVYKDTQARLVGAKPGDDRLFSVSIGLNFENL